MTRPTMQQRKDMKGTAMATTAIVLLGHGARDAGWALPLAQLQSELARIRPRTTVHLAFLELQPPGLPEVLEGLAAAGVTRIDIAPVFWSQAGHVARDLPPLVGAFGARYPGIVVRILPVLSELPGMIGFLAQGILALAQANAGGTRAA
jgi:sirohydrochlorin cobaltochelatase